MSTRTVHAVDEAATADIGERLGASLPAGAAIALHGELGAGKTVLARAIARGLGTVGRVRSPTFTLAAHHAGGRHPLVHADLYRLTDARELPALDLEGALAAGAVVVVEWADRFPDALPTDHLALAITIEPGDARSILATAHGPRHTPLLEVFDG